MICIVVLFCAAAVIGAPAQSASFTTLLSFNGTDGGDPSASLLQASDGNFYGTTFGGGSHNAGTVFKITPSGTVTPLYSFCSQPSCADGSHPYAGLLQGSDGNFYGTTINGGAYGSSCLNVGCGTVFKITPSRTLTTLHSFSGGSDGANPYAGLVQGTDGNLYGTASGGGAGQGTIFKVTPSGTLTTLHSFDYLDGQSPYAGLVQASDGNFYGTTFYGGPYGEGTVFKMTPSGMLTTLYSFGGFDGLFPWAALVQASDGNFYGTASAGGAHCPGQGPCGTVFKITPTGTLTTLYNFCSQPDCTDGETPYAGLVQATDGDFYGTTRDGGANQYGTVFKITTAGTLTTLHSFEGADGYYPYGGLVQANDRFFYGTTLQGGSYGDGTVFRLGVVHTCATCRP